MKISGRLLAKELYEDIAKKVAALSVKKITPRLVIVKSKNIDAVNNYINQKIKKGQQVGVQVDLLECDEKLLSNRDKIIEKVKKLNKDKTIHGIIFQKPSHGVIDNSIEQLLSPEKDVDGFLANSKHLSPIYRGAMKILEEVFKQQNDISEFSSWLSKQKIVVIGKGKTGGGSFIQGLKQTDFDLSNLKIIDSKTSVAEKVKYIKQADIIVSAVGKPHIVDYNLLTSKMILIDIGVHFSEENKIQGDFNEQDIKDRVAFYTTTPGGVGALTVAYLMDNVVNAATFL